jgi:hypothetical protein
MEVKGNDKDQILHRACDPVAADAPVIEAQRSDEPYRFFREFVGLSEDQIGAIRSGKPVAKVIDSHNSDEVFVFGSVMEASPEKYLELASGRRRVAQAPRLSGNSKASAIRHSFGPEGFALKARHRRTGKLQGGAL